MVAWMAVYAGASAAWLVSNYVYHRYKDKPDSVKPKPQEVNIPRTDEGAPIPLIYGRCRVRQPILAWHGVLETNVDFYGFAELQMDMYFVVGVGFNDGAATASGFHGAWYGDSKFDLTESLPSTYAQCDMTLTEGEYVGGAHEWYNGNSAQEHVDSGGVYVTQLGHRILPYWYDGDIPGFRNYISVFLLGAILGTPTQFAHGRSGQISSLSFEVSSNQTTGYPATGTVASIGVDANPANVLWDLLKCKFGKLGIPVELLDMTSFTTAASRLYTEGHGYSRAMEDVKDGAEWILEILRQIDGVIYEDPSDGLIKIRLIRNDFLPTAIPQITKDNCTKIENWSMSSQSGIPNAVRVLYTDRDNDYNENSTVVKLGSNAYGQSNQVRWSVKSFPGCTNATLAHNLAVRELAAECRSITKCRAILDRSFYNLTPGQAVRVTWTKPDIAGVIFRVAAVDRGTLADGAITVDLISDYFYTPRARAPQDIPHPQRPRTEEDEPIR